MDPRPGCRDSRFGSESARADAVGAVEVVRAGRLGVVLPWLEGLQTGGKFGDAGFVVRIPPEGTEVTVQMYVDKGIPGLRKGMGFWGGFIRSQDISLIIWVSRIIALFRTSPSHAHFDTCRRVIPTSRNSRMRHVYPSAVPKHTKQPSLMTCLFS